MNSTPSAKMETGPLGQIQEQCPFYHESGELCRASVSVFSMEPPWRSRFCTSDDHDRCAIFLAKTLRAERLTLFALDCDLEEK